ncbi:AAA family ATPase [Archangium sp.]|uniref:trifunctional serine/threonine-protein kinase/ATP-binding protein/sensor histidine kinase n=1 Tax=Archangium sp. TaxID=1872627 RepID=UPI003899876D
MNDELRWKRATRPVSPGIRQGQVEMMQTIAGYLVLEQLHDGPSSQVFRARRETGVGTVILKMLRPEHSALQKMARFRFEYELTRSLEGEGAPVSHGLETDQNRLLMVLEDFGAESLAHAVRRQAFSIPELLQVAVQVADCLGRLHRRRVIHKDINPSNIVLNRATGQVKLIDFGIATLLTQESPTPSNPTTLEGTLFYISPEQTGRMNRNVDSRSDLYSLGVTLYELFSGQRPFSAEEPLELVHSHIARLPKPLHELVPEIPPVLSGIVDRLMAKNAEERYQSAHGLKADLEECLRQVKANGRIEPFVLGRSDHSAGLRLPQRLYGREREIQVLQDALERTSRGRAELVLISGEAGAGKSALAREVYRPLTSKRGSFIAGKFEQFQRDVPYSSLIQAFRTLVLQLLAGNKDEVLEWKRKLHGALGSNGQIIIAVIPEVELLMGPQPPVPELPPQEAQNRFNLVFRNFIQLFAQRAHPLVLFLDDLQWADHASLKLLEMLLTADDQTGLFVVGAYREDETHALHTLKLMVDGIRKAGVPVSEVRLSLLSQLDLEQFLADTFRCDATEVGQLAQKVQEKTQGNPFFVSEFLQALYVRELIWLEPTSGRWEWDLARIQERDITGNVIKLMREKVQRLSPEAQRALRLAACIGNRFELMVLAIIHERPYQVTAKALWEAVREGLLLPQGDAYRLMRQDLQGLEEELSVEFKFVHDQVQQACYLLIPDVELRQVHRKVGLLLLDRVPAEERERFTFDIVHHLNLSRALIQEPAEHRKLAVLNLDAGRRALASAAHSSALHYLRLGLGELELSSPQRAWHEQYELMQTLHVKAAEAAYLCGAFEQADQWLQTAIDHANRALDKAKAYQVRVRSFIARNQYQEAIQVTLLALGLSGISIPQKPSKLQVLKAILEARFALAGKSMEVLERMPQMTAPPMLMAASLLRDLNSIAFLTDPNLFVLIVLAQIRLGLKHGSTPELAAAFAQYGIILVAGTGEIDSGVAYAQLALRIQERFGAREMLARVIMSVHTFILPWKSHLREVLDPCRQGTRSALETGDFEYAAYLSGLELVFSFYLGHQLSDLEPRTVQWLETLNDIQSVNRDRQVAALFVYRQAALNLSGSSTTPYVLRGEVYDEERILAAHQSEKDVQAHYCLVKLMLCYLFQQYEKGLEIATWGLPSMDIFKGTILLPWYHYYNALTRLALLPETPPERRRESWKEINAQLKKLKKWARHSPMNLLSKYHLLEAERSRALGRHAQAVEHFGKAIALAHEHGYVIEEALAQERAGHYFLERGDAEAASRYLRGAHFEYLRWGAAAKARHLEEQHPQVLAQASAAPMTAPPVASSSMTGERLGSTLDLSSVLKASQAISHELVLGNLLKQLMKILMENAGAQKGVLLLEDGTGRLVVQAEGRVGDEDVLALRSASLEDHPSLSSSIVSYVWRTGEQMVLNDAAREGQFSSDSYIQRQQPKSILCMPIRKQQKGMGVLYLENNLVTGAFSKERIELLNLLSAQAAISLENAQLYDTLEHRVQARTQELHASNTELSRALQQLKQAQAQLVMREKLAWLGVLTSGIAHEIKNPLNFVTNFALLNVNLTDELVELVREQRQNLTPGSAQLLEQIASDMRDNTLKINEHGRRADGIVRSMLELSRTGGGKPREVDLNALVTQFTNLASQELRARNASLNVTLELQLDPKLKPVEVMPQEMGRVLLNLLNNAGHALDARSQTGERAFRAKLQVSTREMGNGVELRVWDNGIGIPVAIQKKIFTPFFTTKPPGQGTGLGLSISHDIIVQGHGGTLEVESVEGQYTEFIIALPRQACVSGASATNHGETRP